MRYVPAPGLPARGAGRFVGKLPSVGLPTRLTSCRQDLITCRQSCLVPNHGLQMLMVFKSEHSMADTPTLARITSHVCHSVHAERIRRRVGQRHVPPFRERQRETRVAVPPGCEQAHTSLSLSPVMVFESEQSMTHQHSHASPRTSAMQSTLSAYGALRGAETCLTIP